MHLWTEYEGRTIAGSYTLGKLLRSEGRNGFFATSDTTGNSAVIRLTEAHFDEEEVLKRWRQVAELHQNHLIEIERVGKTDCDGVALTYALMERNDANLEDVLRERPLTSSETTEVAKSVLAALTTLHASGLVHEHIEPANVLAVGEVVKLRSDCVRECVADGEFTSEEACEELRKRDIHDLGVLLLRCLTLEREWSQALKLPEPFRRIVPAAIDGHMSLRQMDTLLNPPPAVPKASEAAAMAPTQTREAGPVAPPTTGGRAPLVPEGVRAAAAASVAATAAARGTQPVAAAVAEPVMRVRTAEPENMPPPRRSVSKPLWLAGAAVALLLLFALVHVFSGKPKATGSPAQAAAPVAGAPTASDPAVVVAPAPVAPASPAQGERQRESVGEPTAASHAPGWYVIAYTYNHESQARAKAGRVERKRGGLHPVVFSPSGRAPYLVSLGGPMNEGEAEAVLRRARRSGLPRDTFIRHY